MRRTMAMAAGLVACSAAMGDETVTTFFNDGWQYSWNWQVLGQTLTVPDSNVLGSFSFLTKAWGNNEGGSYIIAVYDWDEAGQHIVGEPRYADSGLVGTGDDSPLRTHEIGVLLPKGSKVVVLIVLFADDPADIGVGYTWDDEYAGGSWVSTHGLVTEPWEFPENPEHDLVFTAQFTSCRADVNGDGVLTILDFVAFQNAFTAGSMKADCDQNGVLSVLDFVCFQDVFQAGCGGD